MLESLLKELQQLERPIILEDRQKLMSELHLAQEKLNEQDSRFKNPEWAGRGYIYFHSYQNLLGAVGEYSAHEDRGIPLSTERLLTEQACFAQDLGHYLRLLPASEDPNNKIREIFELILKIGTSGYWNKDKDLVFKLSRIYKIIDENVIKPWVKEGQRV